MANDTEQPNENDPTARPACFEAGDRVRDREDDDTRAIVLEAAGKTAEQSYISALGQTVAEANPNYPADDPVLSVAFVESIEDAMGINWEPSDVVDLAERDELATARIKTYAYPESRLASVEEQVDVS